MLATPTHRRRELLRPLLAVAGGIGAVAGFVALASPSQAAEQSLVLTSCYTDVAGRTFQVAEGDTLRVTFTAPCPWSFNSYVGVSFNQGQIEDQITVTGAMNVPVAVVSRPSQPGQASLVITPNTNLRSSTTSTSNAWFYTASTQTYQPFSVRVIAAPRPGPQPDWQPVGGGTNQQVRSLATGTGDTLYAGGSFSVAGTTSASAVAAWDGAGWRSLGTGISGTVEDLATGPDGALYAGGRFWAAGGTSTRNVARWDGTGWSALGSGIQDDVSALTVDGAGRPVAAAGDRFMGSTVAAWNGSAWQQLGGTFNGQVGALATGSNGRTIAGGEFTSADGTPANRVALWDGATWTPLGSGLNSTVHAMLVDRRGALIVGGDFTSAGGLPANRIARWDGANWSALGSGFDNSVLALAEDADGSILAGGRFTMAGGQPVARVARWDGTAWSAVGTDITAEVTSLAVDTDGDLYAGGAFVSAGGVSAFRIATLAGPEPTPVIEATTSPVAALQQFAVPAETPVSQCSALAPEHTRWAGLDTLPDQGWRLSFAEWPNDGSGGWVCERQPIWADGGWTFP